MPRGMASSFFGSSRPLELDPAVEFGVLPNGFRFLSRANNFPVNRVCAYLHVQTGSVNESRAERGLAHVVEHSVFLGTNLLKTPAALRAALTRLSMGFNADSNAFTDVSETVDTLEAPLRVAGGKSRARAGGAALEREASAAAARARAVVGATADELEATTVPELVVILRELCAGATFAGGISFEGERAAVLSEAATVDTLERRIESASSRQLHWENAVPVREPIGLTSCVRAFTTENARAYYDRNYVPAHMTLVVVGPIKAGWVGALAAAVFGGLTSTSRTAAGGDAGEAGIPFPSLPPLFPPVLNTATLVKHTFDRPPPTPVLVVQHNELTTCRVTLQWKKPLALYQLATHGHFAEFVCDSLLAYVFDARIAALREKHARPPFLAVSFEDGPIAEESCAVAGLYITADAREGEGGDAPLWQSAVTTALTEALRLARYGPQPQELALAVASYVKECVKAADSASAEESEDVLESLLDDMRLASAPLSAAYELSLTLALAPELTCERVAERAREVFSFCEVAAAAAADAIARGGDDDAIASAFAAVPTALSVFVHAPGTVDSLSNPNIARAPDAEPFERETLEETANEGAPAVSKLLGKLAGLSRRAALRRRVDMDDEEEEEDDDDSDHFDDDDSETNEGTDEGGGGDESGGESDESDDGRETGGSVRSGSCSAHGSAHGRQSRSRSRARIPATPLSTRGTRKQGGGAAGPLLTALITPRQVLTAIARALDDVSPPQDLGLPVSIFPPAVVAAREAESREEAANAGLCYGWQPAHLAFSLRTRGRYDDARSAEHAVSAAPHRLRDPASGFVTARLHNGVTLTYKATALEPSRLSVVVSARGGRGDGVGTEGLVACAPPESGAFSILQRTQRVAARAAPPAVPVPAREDATIVIADALLDPLRREASVGASHFAAASMAAADGVGDIPASDLASLYASWGVVQSGSVYSVTAESTTPPSARVLGLERALAAVAAPLADKMWDARAWARLKDAAVRADEAAARSLDIQLDRALAQRVWCGDERVRSPSGDELSEVTLRETRAIAAAVLATANLHVVVVGDVGADAAVVEEAVARVFGALPAARALVLCPAAAAALSARDRPALIAALKDALVAASVPLISASARVFIPRADAAAHELVSPSKVITFTDASERSVLHRIPFGARPSADGPWHTLPTAPSLRVSGEVIRAGTIADRRVILKIAHPLDGVFGMPPPILLTDGCETEAHADDAASAPIALPADWSTVRAQDYRFALILAGKVLNERLYTRLRDGLGASYSVSYRSLVTTLEFECGSHCEASATPLPQGAAATLAAMLEEVHAFWSGARPVTARECNAVAAPLVESYRANESRNNHWVSAATGLHDGGEDDVDVGRIVRAGRLPSDVCAALGADAINAARERVMGTLPQPLPVHVLVAIGPAHSWISRKKKGGRGKGGAGGGAAGARLAPTDKEQGEWDMLWGLATAQCEPRKSKAKQQDTKSAGRQPGTRRHV